MRRPVAAALAATILAGGGAGALVVRKSDKPRPAPVAHVWVDADGGRCERAPKGAVYAGAAACGSFDSAYEAARPGDTVRIRPGIYPPQTMDGPPKGPGARRIAFRGQPVRGGAAGGVVVRRLVISTDRINFSNFRVTDPSWSCPSGNPCGNTQIVAITNAEELSFNNVDVDRNYLVGDGVGINGGVEDLTWRNSTICCNAEQRLVNIQRHMSPELPELARPANRDITFEGLEVGDQVYTATAYAGEPPHAECWYVIAVTELVLEDVVTHDCISTGNMNWGGVGNTTYRFTNTAWGFKYGFEGGVDVVPGPRVGYRSPKPSGAMIDGANVGGSGTIEYSLFAQPWVCSGQARITFRANLGVGCGCEYSEAYNTWSNQACGGTDTRNRAILRTANFVDAARSDWRPARAAAPQVDAGDPSSCPREDADHRPRPVHRVCDQGPYEWAGKRG